jgi:hypothetical protein
MAPESPRGPTDLQRAQRELQEQPLLSRKGAQMPCSDDFPDGSATLQAIRDLPSEEATTHLRLLHYKSMSPRVQKLVQEAADLSSAERLTLIQELVGSMDVSKEQMDRQRRAVLQFLAIPTATSGMADVSSNKYGLPKHDIEG